MAMPCLCATTTNVGSTYQNTRRLILHVHRDKNIALSTKVTYCSRIYFVCIIRNLPINMSSNEECQLKAGHPPAVKAGGMRITQHKTPKEGPGLSEDTTGLQGPHSPPKTLTVSGAIAKGNADFPVEALQSFHKDKPPVNVPQKPLTHIQQPRK